MGYFRLLKVIKTVLLWENHKMESKEKGFRYKKDWFSRVAKEIVNCIIWFTVNMDLAN